MPISLQRSTLKIYGTLPAEDLHFRDAGMERYLHSPRAQFCVDVNGLSGNYLLTVPDAEYLKLVNLAMNATGIDAKIPELLDSDGGLHVDVSRF